MIKKLFIMLLLFLSFWFSNFDYSFADYKDKYWNTWDNKKDADESNEDYDFEHPTLRKRCDEEGNWSGKINCPQFTIDTSTFSPWEWTILEKAREWEWDTVETANIILWTIIRNLIVVFWVLSLLMMTIGWGMMIFHVWQEAILTKWKSIFMYWIISLVVWLSSGIIVQLVSYFLY